MSFWFIYGREFENDSLQTNRLHNLGHIPPCSLAEGQKKFRFNAKLSFVIDPQPELTHSSLLFQLPTAEVSERFILISL